MSWACPEHKKGIHISTAEWESGNIVGDIFKSSKYIPANHEI